MNSKGFIKRFAGPALAGIAMMIVCLTVSALILKLPFIARYLPSPGLPATISESSEAEQSEPEVIAASVPVYQCDSESSRIAYRIASAKSCVTHLDCALSAPRERCLITLGLGFASSIEDDILTYQQNCSSDSPLSALDDLCKAPDRDWAPACEDGQCVLLDPGGQALILGDQD